jgi:hypothetical protein
MSDHFWAELKELDDSVVLATDDEGEELLRFATRWSGETVLLRYPVMRDWDSYVSEVLLILKTLSISAEDLELPDDLTGLLKKEHFAAYSLITATIYNTKGISRRIFDTFVKFLRPEIEGKSPAETRDWLWENAPIDGTVRALVALLSPEQMIKKNVRYGLSTIVQGLTNPSSKASSSKSEGGPKPTTSEDQSSQFAFS